MTAKDCLAALTAADLPITGLRMLDPLDPETWSFDGHELTPEIEFRARAVLVAALATPDVIEPDGLRAEDVLAWCAMKLGVDPIEATLEVASGMMVTDALPIT